MTGLDYLFLFIIGVAGVGGFMRGLAQEVFSLAAWFLAAFAVHYLHTPLTTALQPHVKSETMTTMLAFSMLLLVPYAAMKVIVGNVSEAPEGRLLGPVDRVLGFGFGTVKGVLVGVFAFAMLMLGYDDTWGYSGRPTWIVTARSYPAVDTFSRELVPLIAVKRETLRAEDEAREDAAARAAKGT
ncbi:MAG: CvpA family protein [Porphyrobacter sp.]|jgi:membrane protein required for colicin V production|nr:CvpA family protein [Porphyrobacter sp.]